LLKDLEERNLTSQKLNPGREDLMWFNYKHLHEFTRKIWIFS